MKSKIIIIPLVILLIILFIINALLINKAIYNRQESKQKIQSIQNESYNPQINPNDFTAKVDNKYFTLTPGTTYTYEGKTEEGTERIEVYVTDKIKKIMGVNVVEVLDRVWLEDELIEDTKDWYAQDKYGNVWYFGEDSKEIVNGKIASTAGSWVAGFYDAKPGIVMKANPQIGNSYRQEYYRGVAEDMGDVVALGAKVRVKYGSFENCLQTRDWNPLEPGAGEYKYYCPEAGNVVLEAGIGDGEQVQLVDVRKGSTKIIDEPVEELKPGITEQEAITIAQNAVIGKVTDIVIEEKLGKAAYVVEIDANGVETDVIIDIETGNVLGIET